jgi:hypothetical protein
VNLTSGSVALQRYNRTISYWNGGILSLNDAIAANKSGVALDFVEYQSLLTMKKTFDDDVVEINQMGMSSFGEAWAWAVSNMQAAANNPLAGVCARVRVKLDQELVVQRQAFLATLEITNEGNDLLTDLTVHLSIGLTGSDDKNGTWSRFALGMIEKMINISTNS